MREDDTHLPITTMVAVENTHNKCGGRPLPLDWLAELGKTCKGLGLPLHCDGARIFNAAVSQGKTVAELLQHVDSASICLSKVKYNLSNHQYYLYTIGSRLSCWIRYRGFKRVNAKSSPCSKSSWWWNATGKYKKHYQ